MLTSLLCRLLSPFACSKAPARDHDKHPPPVPPKAVYSPPQPTRGRSYSTSSLASSASRTAAAPVEERVRLDMFRIETGRAGGARAVGLQKPAEGRVLVRAGEGGF